MQKQHSDEPALGGSGWWDIHTHRRDTDWRYAIFDSCAAAFVFPEGERKPCYLSAGIHPCSLTETNIPEQWEKLMATLQDERVVAVGEAGLDKRACLPFDRQCSLFRQVIALADERNLPLLIHVVKASDEIIRLKKALRPRNPWIIHGFRGRRELAQAYLRQGIYLSYGEKYQEASLCATPLDSLFIETDESGTEVRELYKRMAKILSISDETLQEKIRQNVDRLFLRR